MNDRIAAKQEKMKKLEERISRDQAEVKKLKSEIEQLSLLEIKTLAAEANMPIAQVRSLLKELLEVKADKVEENTTESAANAEIGSMQQA